MGGCNCKKTGSFKIKGRGKQIRNIPPSSPLCEFLEEWDSIEATKGLDKIKVIHYCVEVWPNLDVKGGWPWCGTKHKWMCQQVSHYLKAQEDTDPEQLLYATCLLQSITEDKSVRVCKVCKKKEENKQGEEVEKEISKNWDPLDCLPPVAPPIYPRLLK